MKVSIISHGLGDGICCYDPSAVAGTPAEVCLALLSGQFERDWSVLLDAITLREVRPTKLMRCFRTRMASFSDVIQHREVCPNQMMG